MTAPENFGDQPPINETEFAEVYGDVNVRYGEMVLPLSTALKMEADFCDPTIDRSDVKTRLGHLARRVAREGALLDEHRYLLPPVQPESE